MAIFIPTTCPICSADTHSTVPQRKDGTPKGRQDNLANRTRTAIDQRRFQPVLTSNSRELYLDYRKQHVRGISMRFVLIISLVLMVGCQSTLPTYRPVPAGEALIDAATKGDAEKVQTLLAQGAKIEHPNEFGHTTLMWASDRTHALLNAL